MASEVRGPNEPPNAGAKPVSRERPYAGESPEERRAGRRRQLIEAGLELFGTVGYRDTTIERLCAEAGVGIRAFYDEFGTRADLLRQVYDHVIEQAYVRVTTALALVAAESAEERLDCGVRAFLHSMLSDRRCGRIVSIECSGLDASMDIHRNETMNRFAATLTGALTPEQRHALVDLRMWSLMMGGAIDEIIIDWIVSRDRPEIDELADKFMSIWLNTLRT